MDNLSEFAAVFLLLHNEYRAVHGSPPLQIGEQLNQPAQEWADTLASNRVLEYKSDPDYGENIYVSFPRALPREIKPRDPLDYWYREGRYFKYGEEDAKGLDHVRHFTQLVWKETMFIGLGVATDDVGKIYFVAVYQPPGNVAGGFVENVLPPPEISAEMLPHEAKTIRIVEPKPHAARSMERLYSVPSEKLRVWSIWLSKIGEIADEWQRWLRAHIDLSIRLSEQLMAAREALRRAKEEAEGRSKVSSGLGDVGKEPFEEVVGDSAALPSAEDYDEDLAEQGDEAEEEEGTELETGLESETDTEELQAAMAEEETEGEDDSEQRQSAWPLGSPWNHLGIEDPDDTSSFEQLPLPRSEEEMKVFLRKFTYQATIFRSYYKHWRQTADQVIKEVASRPVMATYLVQGRDATGMIKGPAKPAPEKPSEVASKGARKKARRESADEEKFYTPPESDTPAADSDTEIPPAPMEGTPDEEAVSADEGVTADGDAPADEAAPSPPGEEASEMKVDATEAASKSRQSLPDAVVDDLVRDSARAAEDIPYLFYLRAEPDIEIAIEHDDQLVIAEDTDRETIVADYGRVFFNLTDKPCKGGKPWL